MSNKEDNLHQNRRAILEEMLALEAGHDEISVHERIDFFIKHLAAHDAKSELAYDVVIDTADDFLDEGQIIPKNRVRFEEIKKAADDLEKAFGVISKHIQADDRLHDRAMRDVLWNSFLIGLACDREKLDRPEIIRIHNEVRTQGARAQRLPGWEKWEAQVYRAVCAAIPNYLGRRGNRLSKTTKAAETLAPYVVAELMREGHTEEELLKGERPKLTTNIVRTSIGRYMKENDGGV